MGLVGLVVPSQGRMQRATLHRQGRDLTVEGGVDFSLASRDPETGRMCVLQEERLETTEKKPILTCTHRSAWKLFKLKV